MLLSSIRLVPALRQRICLLLWSDEGQTGREESLPTDGRILGTKLRVSGLRFLGLGRLDRWTWRTNQDALSQLNQPSRLALAWRASPDLAWL